MDDAPIAPPEFFRLGKLKIPIYKAPEGRQVYSNADPLNTEAPEGRQGYNFSFRTAPNDYNVYRIGDPQISTRPSNLG